MLHAQGPEPNIAFSQTAESSQLHCKVCPSLLHLLLIPAITCHNYASRAEILVLVSFFSCTTGNAPASLYRLISVDANTFCLALPAAHLRATMSTYVYFFKGILSCLRPCMQLVEGNCVISWGQQFVHGSQHLSPTM